MTTMHRWSDVPDVDVEDLEPGEEEAGEQEQKPKGDKEGKLAVFKPRGIEEQVTCLNAFWPGLITKVDLAWGGRSLPPQVEGLFVIPQWRKIAGTHLGAVTAVCKMLRRVYRGCFRNSYAGYNRPHLFSRHEMTIDAMYRLQDRQRECDAIVLPAQTGVFHQGMPVKLVRQLCEADALGLGEFPLDSFMTGIILLTHPERLLTVQSLGIDSPGDQINDPAEPSPWSEAGCYLRTGDSVYFYTCSIKSRGPDHGSATGFLLS